MHLEVDEDHHERSGGEVDDHHDLDQVAQPG
jgi:hypothetical protein